MLVAVDLDGTIDAAPAELRSTMTALRAAGHLVIVCTGGQGDTPEELQSCAEAKRDYMATLGVVLGTAYDELVVVQHPDTAAPGDYAEAKATYLEQRGCDVLIDNDKGNAKAAMDRMLVLVPWASRE